MSPLDLYNFRQRLGLSQAAAACLIGIKERAWRYYEADRAVPTPIARLIALCDDPKVLARLAQLSGVSL